jgi:hypothetical protein
MLNSWEYVPDWFLVLVFVIAAGFTVLNVLLTKGKVEPHQRKTNGAETKAFYYENPLKVMTKSIEIIDVQMNEAGQLRREFLRLGELLLSLILPNYFVVIKGESEGNHISIRIEKQRGKKSRFESSWDIEIASPNKTERVVMSGKNTFTEGVSASFSYGDDVIKVSENRKDKSFHFRKNNLVVATVTPIGKIPPRKIFIDRGKGELPLLLVAGIYEALKLYR